MGFIMIINLILNVISVIITVLNVKQALLIVHIVDKMLH